MNPDAPQFEKYWRNKIAQEIKDAIESGSQINAMGAYMIALYGSADD